MSTATALMTTEEFLALPDDGVERWLDRGQLREWGKPPMTVRNRFHSQAMSRISHLLEEWLEKQPEPRGGVASGDAGCRLRRDPDTTVGIDVVYLSPELAASEPDDTTLIDGVPTLAIEILSPYDTQVKIHEKIKSYQDAGVPLIWIVDPYDYTVRVYRNGAEPELFNINDELTAAPHLPGLRIPVARIFSR